MKSRLPVLLVSVFISQLPVFTWANEAEVRNFVSTQLNTLFHAAQQESQGEEIGQVLRRTVNFPKITQGVLGQHSITLSEDQVARFQNAFEQSIQRLLVTALSQMGVYELTIEKVKFRGDRRAQINVIVSTSENQRLEIIASVEKADAQWNVLNLIINGVNLGLTFRSQFDNLMKKHTDAEIAISAWASALSDPTL